MVKIKGPMGSAGAAGSFGGTAVYSSWKGRQYVRAKVIPTNPKTTLQVSTRAVLGFLSSQWSAFSAPNKTTWSEPAHAAKLAPYHAYISANLNRWRQFKAPTKTHPAAETGTLPDTELTSATGGPNYADILIEPWELQDGWGIIIFRSTEETFTPDNTNAIALHAILTLDAFTHHDPNLTPGYWWYRTRVFTHTGKLGPDSALKRATVT